MADDTRVQQALLSPSALRKEAGGGGYLGGMCGVPSVRDGRKAAFRAGLPARLCTYDRVNRLPMMGI